MRAPSADSTVSTRVFATAIGAIDIALPHFCTRTVAPAHRASRLLRRATAGTTNGEMKFQFSGRHIQTFTILAAVAVTFPAAAQERAPEPPLKSRDAKTAEAAAPTVDLKIEGVRNGL